MTRNQKLAVRLAAALSRGRTDPMALSDEQWNLLLLAAGINCPGANPDFVARRVLSDRAARSGYFAGAGPGDAPPPPPGYCPLVQPPLTRRGHPGEDARRESA